MFHIFQIEKRKAWPGPCPLTLALPGNLYNRERRHFELEIRRLGALRSDGGSGARGLRSGRGPSKARRKNEDGPGALAALESTSCRLDE